MISYILDNFTHRKIRTFVILIFMFYGSSFKLHAQNQARINDVHFNTWWTYIGDYRFAQHWSLHNEAHIRRNNGIKNWQQLLIRPAINYHFNPDIMFTLGYSNYHTYPYGLQPVVTVIPEHHTFEQLQFKHLLVGKIEITHRYRLEQRFQGQAVKQDNNNYDIEKFLFWNRFRYKVTAQMPLKKWEGTEKMLFVNIYDEIFINFGENIGYNVLDQNRLSINAGYKFNKNGNIQLGYLYQIIEKKDGIHFEHNNTLVTTLTYNLDFRKQD